MSRTLFIMETQILEPCIFVKGQKANILQDADFFNIVETLQMALGSIGDVLRGPAAPGHA